MPLIGHSGKTATGNVALGLALTVLAALAGLAALPAMAAPAPGQKCPKATPSAIPVTT